MKTKRIQKRRIIPHHLLSLWVSCLLFSLASSLHAQNDCRYLVIWRDFTETTIEDTFLSEVRDSLQTVSSDSLRVGVNVMFNLLSESPEVLVNRLNRILELSVKDDVPVCLQIDGQNWARSEFWNWWDPTKPGYDPNNKYNVEWTDWNPDTAVKISWRNWGRQIRITPGLNIFAPKVVEAHREGYKLLMPIIRRWRDSLPPEKRYLFIGLHIGWETGFNYNTYYFKGGNELYEKYPDTDSHDPKERTTHDTFAPENNTLPLGYASATSLGLKHDGALTNGDYEIMIHRYLETWCKEAASYGFQPHEIFTHMGGNYEPFERHLHFWPAINDYSTPGWSFYDMNPHQAGTLLTEMKAAGVEEWSAIEWLWLSGNDQAEETLQNLRTTFSFQQCKSVMYCNWHGLKNTKSAIQAIRRLWEKP